MAERSIEAENLRVDIGKRIIAMEEEESRKRHQRRYQEEESKKSIIDDSLYHKEERIVYVTGFDRQLAFVDLENYLKKYGEIV